MRFHGTLERWNDDRGFGFIKPTQGGESVFVHISAFARDGRRPKVGESLSFDVEPADDGKKRAINVQRPGRTGAPRARLTSSRSATSGSRWSRIIALAAAVLAVGFAYSRYASFDSATPPMPMPTAPAAFTGPAGGFRCDGRTMCSQMTSCDEAKFFLNNCPGTQMDGDRDGIPCERQWCGRH